MIPLSVLDLSPVTTATPGSAALRNSLDLARLADRLGYKRYWVAEHHNLANIASSSPEIMIGQIAAATSHLRVGSGGVMLPNHAPLMVAERFKVLEALFPGRIDLGLGRAPGTDQVTSYALRARQDARQGDDFLERFQELLLLERGGYPEGHPFRKVHAVPSDVALPPIWLLGSSSYSAQLAAAAGLGFAFAHHFADYDAASAMLSLPRAVQAVGDVCGALCDPGHGGDRGRNRCRGRTHRVQRRPALRPPRQGRICPARLARGGRRLSLFADRPRTYRARSEPASSSAASIA